MTSSDIDRLESAARSVFGHEDTDADTIARNYTLTERIFAYLQKFLPAVTGIARRA